MDSQYSFTKVSENSKSEVEDIVRSSNVYSNFSSFYTLNTYFNSTGKELFIAKTDRDRRILFLRKRNSDVRILFNYSTSDQKLINDIKRHFKPNYLAYNLLGWPVKRSENSVRQEAVVDLQTISSLSDPKLNRDHALFIRKHPGVVFRKINETQNELIEDFLV